MLVRLTFLTAACFALAAPAGAETWAHYNWRTHHARAYRHTPSRYSQNGDAPQRSFGNSGSDCPNGDCRGLNSPGDLGGAPGNF